MTDPWNPDYVEVVTRLKVCRKRAGLSQKDLAASLGKAQSYVSKIETCERRVDVIELLTLCDAIGAPLRDVVPDKFLHLLNKVAR